MVVSKHGEQAPQDNPFQQFRLLGYPGEIPVVPPGGGITNAGKRPGIKVAGKWQGRAAADFKPSPEALEIWAEMGASLGLSCNATGLCAIDVDSLNQGYAERITEIAFETFGKTARRIGRSPKVLLPYRCAPETLYRQLRFLDGRPGLVKDGKKIEQPALVELLAGEGKWFVAAGIHPQTGQAYAWPDGTPAFADLPLIDEDQLQLFFSRLAAELPSAVRSGTAAARTREQESLRGDPAMIAEAMAAIPNDPAKVGYKQWQEMAAALRGAVDYETGLELFQEWTDKADIAEPTERADRVYASLDQGNIRLGADYIYSAAEAAGWKGGSAVWRWHDAAAEAEGDAVPASLFPYGGEADEADEPIVFPRYAWQDPATVERRDFLYGTHIVRGFASMLIAPSKTGKSSLATVEALAMVTGRQLLADKPKNALRLFYFNGEDPAAELTRRFAAACKYYGIGESDIGGRLFVASGRTMRLVVAIETREGVRILRPVFDGMLREIKDKGIDVLSIDPFVASHRVSENNNMAMEAVVAEWVALAEAANVAIDFVHHSRKPGGGALGGDTSIDSARGASAVGAKMRASRAIARMTRQQAEKLGVGERYRSYFHITDAQSNLVDWVDDETLWFRLVPVALGNGDEVATVALHRARADPVALSLREEALNAIRGASIAWRKDSQARDAWVGVPIANVLGLDLEDADDKAQVKAIIKAWINDGALRQVERYDVKTRKVKVYVEVVDVFA